MTVETQGLTQFLERADDDAIEARVADLPREQIVGALHLATTLRKALQQFEKMAQSRIETDGILTVGETWIAPDGAEFFWAGDRHREVADPEGLRQALQALALTGLAERAARNAFKPELKVYLRELDEIVKFGPAEAKDVISDFTKWKEGPRKLRPLGEEPSNGR